MFWSLARLRRPYVHTSRACCRYALAGLGSPASCSPNTEPATSPSRRSVGLSLLGRKWVPAGFLMMTVAGVIIAGSVLTPRGS